MAKSFLEPEGLFNPTLRFAFTNITKEDFTSKWDGAPIVVKAGQTIELPHHLAVKLTGELVDKIMIGDVKLVETKYYQNNPGATAGSYRAPSSLGVPAARKVWEDQIVRQMAVDEESPQMQIERIRIREELMRDLQAEPSRGGITIPTNVAEEFAEIKSPSATSKPVPKKPMKLKTIIKPDEAPDPATT